MPLPIDLVLVRHAESEGNAANRHDRQGDQSFMTEQHLKRHQSEYRLTDRGIEQAKAAGEWIRKNFPGQFDYCLTSDFARAKETAAYLGLEGPGFEIEPYLVERDHGDLDGLTSSQRQEKFGEDYIKKYIHHFYRRPPNGESRLDLTLRFDRVMSSLIGKRSEHRVLIVAHQTIIEAGLIRRLHWTVEQFYNWKIADDPTTKIHNCQVIHFSRRDPETARIGEHVRWWRTVCPWQMHLTSGEWRPIKPRLHTNEELLEEVNQLPRLFP